VRARDKSNTRLTILSSEESFCSPHCERTVLLNPRTIIIDGVIYGTIPFAHTACSWIVEPRTESRTTNSINNPGDSSKKRIAHPNLLLDDSLGKLARECRREAATHPTIGLPVEGGHATKCTQASTPSCPTTEIATRPQSRSDAEHSTLDKRVETRGT
jgi:hypothetical protein